MPDAIYYNLLLLVMIVLVCLVAFVFGRRLQARGGPDWWRITAGCVS